MRLPVSDGRLLALGLGVLLAGVAGWMFWSFGPRPAATPPVAFHEHDRVMSNWEDRPLHKAKAAPGGLVRWQITRDEASGMMPSDDCCSSWKGREYDPHTFYRYTPHHKMVYSIAEGPRRPIKMTANGLGLRQDDEILEEQPDLRVLITGDSHSEGTCRNRDSFASRLEAQLAHSHPGERIETINASVGGFSFYNYLGCLERFLHLAPDIFIVAFYSGNDFDEVLTMYHYFNGSFRPQIRERYGESLEAAKVHDAPALAQGLLSLMCFKHFPEEQAVALRAAGQVAQEMKRICDENSIRLVFVHIPSAMDAQPQAFGSSLSAMASILHLSPEDLAVNHRLSQRFLEYLREQDIEVLDLQEAFASDPAPLFWKREWHVNVDGHKVIAAHLRAALDGVDPPQR